MRKVYYRCIALCVMSFLFIQQSVFVSDANISNKNSENIAIQWLGEENDRYSNLKDDTKTFNTTEFAQLESMKQLNILPALEKYAGKESVVIAVLDTGIDYAHEDLYQNIWTNVNEVPQNGIDDDGNGYVDDVYGWDFCNNDNTVSYSQQQNTVQNQDYDNHGTHCAGLIAGMQGNELGIAGIAGQGNAKIMIVKVFDQSKGNVSVSRLIQGIRYAVAMGADIINASWSGTLDSEEDAEQLKEAIQESGKLFITSAGNYGENIDRNLIYPASFSELDNVVVVASVEEDGTLSSFSDYGESVHVAADGNNIYSTLAGSRYGYYSGTSMSTAIVSGIAALVYGMKSHVYPKAVKELLLYSCNLLTLKEDGKSISGGIIDAEKVVNNINLLLTDEKIPIVYDMQKNYNGDIVFSILEQGGSKLCSMNYAKGEKSISYFLHGMGGTKLEKPEFHVEKTGKYTIFLRDYAGNESVKVVYLLVDKETPDISASIDKKYIIFHIIDKDTKVVKVKYAYGRRKIAYFKSGNGKNITLKNSKIKIKYKQKQKYITVYAEDKVGNKRVTPFILKN